VKRKIVEGSAKRSEETKAPQVFLFRASEEGVSRCPFTYE